MTSEKLDASNLELINTVEKKVNVQEADVFFRLEAELLQQIFSLERDKARHTFKEIQDILSIHTPEISFKIIRNYFIVLSSIVTRQLQEASILNEKKAFIFSATCMELIDANLTMKNVSEIGDELIEFYLYILKEKEKPTFAHETVNQVIEYIDQNVEKQLIVEEIAQRFNVSTSHLSRIFREHTTVTLVEFITIRKIEEVQYYLRFTDQKIAEIAERFHFCNQSYFTRVFKKYTGLTPRRFRKDLDGNYFQFTMKKDDSL
ncbi:helix-turn-helix domain-containing protein [Sporosarcina obsidiansis]|uniref:helix-turn-helix domain-containing protein n=1 Tax=Sporosarcina obsidiansis TaxID=2660748 RepID=UPI001890D45D|nr:helix-turn-helix domain-containing protein [Sporosarcina obsidiansis]